MKKITSDENKNLKYLKQLQLKKYRDRERVYLIEGENAVREAMINGVSPVLVAVDEDKQELYSEMFGGFIDDALLLPSRLFSKVCATSTSQGIVAAVPKNAAPEKLPAGPVVVLDRLQDPGNIGTIIRTCDAAGISAVIAVKGCADIYSPKTVRSAAGSVFRVPVYDGLDTGVVIELLKAAGRKIIGTSFNTSHMYYDVDMTGDTAIVIGNEGNGMSGEFMDACDVSVKIPMKGTIESLNASVAAGILIYETIRQER